MGKISLVWFNKKCVLFFSLTLVILNTIATNTVNFGICPGYPTRCFDKADLIISYTYIFIPVFFFSLITFFTKPEVSRPWIVFSFFMVPLSLILISFLPTYTHGLDFVPLTKGTAIFGLTVLYSLISLILIIFKSIQLRNQK